MLSSVLIGGIVGWERRQADRPAGIRTMALVCLGSCLFAITSAFAFRSGPMSWDASRIAAAIPSGVGFLGAGLIWKQAQKEDDGTESQAVHGLTTAASLWLSAALGIACGEAGGRAERRNREREVLKCDEGRKQGAGALSCTKPFNT